MTDGQKPNKPLFSQHYLEHRIQECPECIAWRLCKAHAPRSRTGQLENPSISKMTRAIAAEVEAFLKLNY